MYNNKNLEYRINQLEKVLQEVADNTDDKKLLAIIEKGIVIKKGCAFSEGYFEYCQKY